MTQRYNTNNPVPSNAMMDLNDNAIVFDEFVNKTSGNIVTRQGVIIPALQKQVESRIDDLMADAIDAVYSAQDSATLAQTAAENAQSISDGGTTFATTAEGIAATTSGQYFRVPQGTGSEISFIYYLNNAGVALAVAQQVGKVTPSSTGLLGLGKNIYNYLTSLSGKFLNESGSIADNPAYALSDYIKVQSLSYITSRYNLRFVHFFDSNRNYLSYVTYQDTFQVPSDALYIRVTVAIASISLLQLEYGNFKTSFEPFTHRYLNLPSDGVNTSVRDLIGIKVGKNIFNKNTATRSYFIDNTNTLLVGSTYCVSDYIPINSVTSYRGNRAMRYINYYDSYKNLISSVENINASFTTPDNSAFMRVSFLLSAIDIVQVESGTMATKFEDYTLTAANALDSQPIKYPYVNVSADNIGIFDTGKNIFNPYTLITGYIDENGFLFPGGSTYQTSDYLPVTESQPYISNKSMRFVSFYSSDYGWLSTATSTTAITPPVGAAFIRVTLAVANIASFQLESGTSSTSYEAYHYKIKSNLDNGIPVVISPSMSDDTTPDSFGLERLRETHQRLNKLSFSATGLTARLTWAMIGDSYTRDSSRYPLRCARRLWSLYQSGAANVSSGPIGWGYLSFGGAGTTSSQNGSIVNPSAVTQSGFVGAYYGGDSPDISVMQSSTVGSTLSWSEDFRLSRSHTLFAEGGSGVISYQATGMSAATQIDLSALPAGIQVIPLTDIPTANNGTMTITVISGTVKLYGMNIVDASAAGVVCHKLGASGSSSADWVARNATRWQSSFGNLEANLTTIMLGTNDQGAAMTPETFKANIITMIDRIRAARPTTDILLVCPQENQRTTNTYPMTKYAQAMYEIARDDRDVGFLWLQQSFGVNPADYAYGSARPWMISDGIHPDPDTGGYAIVAALMRAFGLPAL